jgi:hypothetical protein
MKSAQPYRSGCTVRRMYSCTGGSFGRVQSYTKVHSSSGASLERVHSCTGAGIGRVYIVQKRTWEEYTVVQEFRKNAQLYRGKNC